MSGKSWSFSIFIHVTTPTSPHCVVSSYHKNKYKSRPVSPSVDTFIPVPLEWRVENINSIWWSEIIQILSLYPRSRFPLLVPNAHHVIQKSEEEERGERGCHLR